MSTETVRSDLGLFVESEACERFALEHVANDPSTPDWVDAYTTTRTPVSEVDAGVPVDSKGAQETIPDGGSPRSGRWWFDRRVHEHLLEAAGWYTLSVHGKREILRCAMLPARTIDGFLEERWTSAGADHYADRCAQLPWTVLLVSGAELDPGGGR